ncbi:unnamed protein product, partial [marine sediment metagenome]
MEVEILVIGNEILIGKTQDTNSYWMAKRITKYGHRLKRITDIEDSIEVISNTLQTILKRKPDIIITSGGIGPTFDDMTLAGIAKGLNRELEEEAKDYINLSEEEIGKIGLSEAEEVAKAFGFPEGNVYLFKIHDQDAINQIDKGIELSKEIIKDADRIVLPSDNNNHSDHQAT